MANLSCGGTLMKWLLFLFNFIFFLCGTIILAVGIWLKVDPEVKDWIENIFPSNTESIFNAACYTLIGVGAFIFLVGFLGCCGACKESSGMLCMYAILLIVVLIGFFVGAIMAIVFRRELGDGLKVEMVKQVENEVEPADTEKPTPVSLAWHALQVKLKCCGAVGYMEYRNNSNFNKNVNPVPVTCCKLTNTDAKQPRPQDENKCIADAKKDDVTESNELYLTGCYDALSAWFTDKSGILIGVGIGIGLVQILGIVFACCVRNEVKDV